MTTVKPGAHEVSKAAGHPSPPAAAKPAQVASHPAGHAASPHGGPLPPRPAAQPVHKTAAKPAIPAAPVAPMGHVPSAAPVVHAAPVVSAAPPAPAPAAPPASAYISEVPFQQPRIGAAAIYCSDGRYGDQMDEFLHHALGLPRYDRVAVPGGCACLAHITALREAGAMEKQLRFLIESHQLDRIILIAHEDCGFYKHVRLRVPLYSQQLADLKLVADRIRGFGLPVKVEAFFARKIDEMVQFEPVKV